MKKSSRRKSAPHPPGRGSEFSSSSKLGPFRWEWIILAAALLCDINSWGHQFVMDDKTYIFDAGLKTLRPVTHWTLQVNQWLTGPNPDGFHIVNRLLHVLICLLILWTLRELIAKPSWVAPLTSLLFAVHPFQVEAVTYIQGRSDSLVMLFFMLAWYFHIRARKSIISGGRLFVLAAVLYGLALFSKENAITWLGVVLLTEWTYFSEGSFSRFLDQFRREGWKYYAGYGAVTLAYLARRVVSLQGGLGGGGWAIENPLIKVSLASRELTALKIMFLDIFQFLWPVSLSPDYSYNQIPLITRWSSSEALLVVALVAVTCTVLALSYRFSRNIFFGLSFFFVTFSVVSNLFFDIGSVRADRWLYMPSLGLCLVVVLGLARVESSMKDVAWKKALWSVVTGALILLAVRTIVRNGDWKDQFTLYLKALKTSPNSVKVRTHLGWEYYVRNELDKSLEQFRVAEAIDPNYADLMTDIGALYLRQGKNDEAISYFERAIALDPQNMQLVRINIGSALKNSGDLDGAIHQYDLVLSRFPENANAHFNKGNAFYAQGKLKEAAAEYSRALELDPQLQGARTNLDVVSKRLQESTPVP